jgi:hypothetical protein
MGNIVGEKNFNLIKNKALIFLNHYFNVIIFVVFLAIIISGLFIFVKPKYESVRSSISKTKETETAEYLKQSVRLEELKKIKENYDKISQKDIKKLDLMVPSVLDKEELLVQLEKIILQNGLLFSNLAVKEAGGGSQTADKSVLIEEPAPAGDSSSSGEIKSLNISLPLTGVSYEGLKNILKVFQNNLRLMDINSISYNPGGQTINLEITTYYIE